MSHKIFRHRCSHTSTILRTLITFLCLCFPCSGSGVSGKDYCYDESEADNLPPSPNPTPIPPTGSNYRLRLYWEDGYYWQESYDEMFFCMVSSGDKVKIETCGSGNTRWEIVPLSGQGDQIRKSGSNQCIELIGSRAIALRGCDASVTRQRWMAVMGAFNDYRFDIRPVRDLAKCLTQHHHPKPGEDVFAEFCSTAHQHTTGESCVACSPRFLLRPFFY